MPPSTQKLKSGRLESSFTTCPMPNSVYPESLDSVFRILFSFSPLLLPIPWYFVTTIFPLDHCSSCLTALPAPTIVLLQAVLYTIVRELQTRNLIILSPFLRFPGDFFLNQSFLWPLRACMIWLSCPSLHVPLSYPLPVNKLQPLFLSYSFV